MSRIGIYIKKVGILLSKGLFTIIYRRKYLSGKWFESFSDWGGWKYCWRYVWDQKVKGYNRHIPFPVNPTTTVGLLSNIHFDVNNIDNFWKNGCYYQCWKGEIHIGSGTWIAQNVGIITENHDPMNLEEHLKAQDVYIGDNCWIGMNAVILPGVKLGNKTIVGANSVVTHSFEDGFCVIAGTPARIIRQLK